MQQICMSACRYVDNHVQVTATWSPVLGNRMVRQLFQPPSPVVLWRTCRDSTIQAAVHSLYLTIGCVCSLACTHVPDVKASQVKELQSTPAEWWL